MAASNIRIAICLLALVGVTTAAPCPTSSVTSGNAPATPNNGYYVLNCPVDGDSARQACIDFGASISKSLQLANLPQRDVEFVTGLVKSAIGENPAYINTAPNYETPFDIPNRPSAGPVGRNYLTIKPKTFGSLTTAEFAPVATFPTTKGNKFQVIPVVCNGAGPVPQPPPLCTKTDNPEFFGWAVTLAKGGPNAAAENLCPPGWVLGNVALNNLYRQSDQTLPNSNNPHDGTGFPFLPDLIAQCAPGERVWVNTSPSFTTSGLCTSIDGSPGPDANNLGGNRKGARATNTPGGLGLSDPLCTATLRSLCFNPIPDGI